MDPSIRMNPGMEIEGEGSIEVNYDLDGRLVLSYSKKKINKKEEEKEGRRKGGF